MFFSFFRKFIQKKSPIYPDRSFAHVSYYKILSRYGKNKADFLNAIFINIIYLILVIPGIFFVRKSTVKQVLVFYTINNLCFDLFRLYRLTKN